MWAVQDINSLSELSSSIIIDLWYSQIWTDKRLAFSNQTCLRNLSFDYYVIPRSGLPLHVPIFCSTLARLEAVDSKCLHFQLQTRPPPLLAQRQRPSRHLPQRSFTFIKASNVNVGRGIAGTVWLNYRLRFGLPVPCNKSLIRGASL